MTSATDSAASVFTAPRRLTGQADRALSGWLTSLCGILAENWQALLGSSISLTAGRPVSTIAAAAVGGLPDPGFGARVEMGPDGFPSLFALSSRLTQTLVYDMLGNPGDDWPEPAELTPAELSMTELLMGEICRAASQAWPEIEPLPCDLVSVVARPRRSRIFSPDTEVVLTTITVETAFGPDDVSWIVPKSGLESIGIQDSGHEPSGFHPAPELRDLARLLPVELVVELGTTSLTLKQLNELKVGDYLPLDQPVSQPLQALVDGRMQWLGMPCRLGNRQGFQILASRGGSDS